MGKQTAMSEGEREIMEVVWAAGSPITSNEILKRLSKEKKPKITTVLTFLSRLADKGLITSDKEGKKNLYYPLMSESEYIRLESRLFLESLHGGSIRSFVATLFDDENISREEIEELKKWLSQR